MYEGTKVQANAGSSLEMATPTVTRCHQSSLLLGKRSPESKKPRPFSSSLFAQPPPAPTHSPRCGPVRPRVPLLRLLALVLRLIDRRKGHAATCGGCLANISYYFSLACSAARLQAEAHLRVAAMYPSRSPASAAACISSSARSGSVRSTASRSTSWVCEEI